MIGVGLFVLALLIAYVAYRMYQLFTSSSLTDRTHTTESLPTSSTSTESSATRAVTNENTSSLEHASMGSTNDSLNQQSNADTQVAPPPQLDDISSESFIKSDSSESVELENELSDSGILNTGTPIIDPPSSETTDNKIIESNDAITNDTTNTNTSSNDTLEITTMNSTDIGTPANNGDYGHEQLTTNSNVANEHTDTKNQINAADDMDEDDIDDDDMDIGDMTLDVSEMLKELNLRETDSPRLEIDEQEYKQLKTGEPGEVNPEKIEVVASKLRDMLQ